MVIVEVMLSFFGMYGVGRMVRRSTASGVLIFLGGWDVAAVPTMAAPGRLFACSAIPVHLTLGMMSVSLLRAHL